MAFGDHSVGATLVRKARTMDSNKLTDRMTRPYGAATKHSYQCSKWRTTVIIEIAVYYQNTKIHISHRIHCLIVRWSHVVHICIFILLLLILKCMPGLWQRMRFSARFQKTWFVTFADTTLTSPNKDWRKRRSFFVIVMWLNVTNFIASLGDGTNVCKQI